MAFVMIRFLMSIDTTKPRIAGLYHFLICEGIKTLQLAQAPRLLQELPQGLALTTFHAI